MTMESAAPALKPVRMLSEMKLTITLSRRSQASRNRPAVSTVASAASDNSRSGSPPAICATVTPKTSEMAEVGPIARCRDDPKRT